MHYFHEQGDFVQKRERYVTFKIPVPIVDLGGMPHEPTEEEMNSIYEHVHCSEFIESSWIKSVVVNAQESAGHPHQIVIQGYFMDDLSDPFVLCFSVGAHPSLAECSHEKLKKSA